MAKETKETFSGKTKDQSFEVFDEKVLTWCRKQFGDNYAKGLWHNKLTEIENLLLDDEEDNFTFEMHCATVYEVLALKSPKEADHLYQSERFWSKKWQLEFRQRCRERIFCHLEEVVSGEAARQLRKSGVKKMKTMRDFMFRRFGAGQPEVLQERVRKYLLGIPDTNGVAFPPRVDIEAKLDALEEEREYLLEMCPVELRDTYEDGKEETLIRLLLRQLPAEYDGAVKAVKDLARLRKYSERGKLEAITNCEDNTRANYAIDYLPDYAELRFELIRTYQLAERRRNEMNKTGGKKGHPSFPIMDGHTQPGPGMQSCYRCGVKGHRAGDPACKGKEGEVHKDAPDWYRKQNGTRAQGGKGHGKGNGKGKGKGKKGGMGNRNAKPLCYNWSQGNGYCRYAAACKFSHDGPQGGDKRKRENGSTTSLPAKAVKRAKQEIMAMVMGEIKGKGDTAKPKESKAEQASNSLLALVRGERKRSAASMLGVDLKKDLTDFVPSRNEPAVETVLMIPRPCTKAREFRPVRGNPVEGKGASNTESGINSCNVEKDMSITKKKKNNLTNLTKTDPLSIKNPKKDTL